MLVKMCLYIVRCLGACVYACACLRAYIDCRICTFVVTSLMIFYCSMVVIFFFMLLLLFILLLLLLMLLSLSCVNCCVHYVKLLTRVFGLSEVRYHYVLTLCIE